MVCFWYGPDERWWVECLLIKKCKKIGVIEMDYPAYQQAPVLCSIYNWL